MSRDQVIALMTIDVSKLTKEFADIQMIDNAMLHVQSTGFATRKYNQIRYFWNLLEKLDDLQVVDGNVYFATDPRAQVVSDDTRTGAKGRDSYLQRLYKNLLIEESKALYSTVCCMAEKLDYPGLIASHIKPYSHSDSEEAFDGNNGLLLSRNADILFDQGYITFLDDGSILITSSPKISNGLKERISNYSLDPELLTSARRRYLDYHRNHIFIT